MVSVCSEKPIIVRSTPSLSPRFSNVAFEAVPMFVWLTIALCRPFFVLLISPPGHRWCDALGFVPAGSVSSSSTLKIFRDSSHSRWLLFFCQSVSCYFPNWLGIFKAVSLRRRMSNIDTCQSGLRIPLFTFCSKLIENAMDFVVGFFGKFLLHFLLSFSVLLEQNWTRWNLSDLFIHFFVE